MVDLFWLDWPAPPNVKACYSLRSGGVSQPPFDSFNLATHVDDNPADVDINRQQLQSAIGGAQISWLQQVHGDRVVAADGQNVIEADANVSKESGVACCVMTADCLPVFFCDRAGQQVAVAHAGWRGLQKGILQNTLATFADPKQVLVYLGPAISQVAFEVGDEVRTAFLERYPNLNMAAHFVMGVKPHKWLCDLYGIANTLLNDCGVDTIYGGDRCTLTESDSFFSYRRDGQTGRMANLIWRM